jgi:DNA-binding CsgD family transcriptional regulator
VLAAAEAAVAGAGVARTIGSRREADAHLATARAFQARFDGRDDASAWDALARTWEAIEMPYQVARARWRQAEAALGAGDGRSGRGAARRPLLDAVRLARELGARPLLRELEELAGRARIVIPEDGAALPGDVPEPEASPVAVGVAGPLDGSAERSPDGSAERSPDGSAERSPDGSRFAREFVGPARPKSAVFGLSPREREVLLLLSAGRTNREIGEHLFISQKTVGVHVGNILAKLSVSGRVEAAAVAIRLGLTDSRSL